MQFGWQVLLSETPDGSGVWLGWLLGGLGRTLLLVALAWMVAVAAGVLVGVARTTPVAWLRHAGDAYVQLFRNIPLLVQFFIWYFVLPELVPALKDLSVSMDPQAFSMACAVVCLGLYTSARIAEQVKAAILALPRGYARAARALGLRELQVYRLVLLPSALRVVLPPLTSESMNLVKNSAVAYSIGLSELFMRTKKLGESTFEYFLAFAVATVLYVVVALSINRVFAALERALAVPGLGPKVVASRNAAQETAT